MLLEIEEQNGPRVLKYRFVATAEAPQEKAPDEKKKDAPSEETPVPDSSVPKVTDVTVE